MTPKLAATIIRLGKVGTIELGKLLITCYDDNQVTVTNGRSLIQGSRQEIAQFIVKLA